MSTSTTTTPARPSRPSRSRARRKTTTAAAPERIAPGTAANPSTVVSSAALDYAALNRLVSAYLAGHRGATLGECSVIQLMAWADPAIGARSGQRTMTAGAR